MSEMEVNRWQDQSDAEEFVLNQNITVLLHVEWKVQSRLY